jgi:hypothetical protein
MHAAASPFWSRTLRVIGAAILALALLSGAWFLPERGETRETTDATEATDASPEGTPDAAAPHRPAAVALSRAQAEAEEREAIASHLQRVEKALRAAPTGHLDEGRRLARAALLDELRAYHEAGVFPRNHAAPGRVPVFVDDQGTHCAVGYLLHRTGEDGIVRSIRESRNLAHLPDLLDEPGLAVWLDAHGLEAGEAAWIQPAYCNMQQGGTGDIWFGCPGPVNESEAELTGRYLVASVGASGIGGALATVNLLDLRRERPTRGRAFVGLAAGVAGIGLGVAGIREGGDPEAVGWTNLVVGAFGVTTSAWTFHRAASSERPPVGPAPVAQTAGRPITVRPWVPEGVGDGGARAFGLQVRIGR